MNSRQLICWILPLLWASIAAISPAVADDSLRVENSVDIAFSVSRLSNDASGIGLSDAGIAEILSTSLMSAGLVARSSGLRGDEPVLFVDIIVEGDSYYASLDYWRMASIALPDGEINSDYVTVWQDFAFGSHGDAGQTIRDALKRIVERFVIDYRDANAVDAPLRIAAIP